MAEPIADPPKADPPPKQDPPADPPAKKDPAKGEDPPKADPPAKTYTQADFDRAIAKAVKDAEKKAAEAEAKAKLSEDEKLKAENEELRNSIRMRDARDAVGEALQKAGAKSPALLFKSVQDQLEFDDKGKIANLDTLVADLAKDFPEQFGTPKPEDGIDAGAGQGQKGTSLTLAQLEKMTPQEIAKLPWDDVKAAMAAKQ